MNELFRLPGLRPADLAPTTRAAEGLERRRWSVAEIEELVKVGIIDERERFELIGGEIVPMNAKGIAHETLKMAMNYHFVRSTSDEFRFAVETTFRLSDDTFLEPDFVFYRTSDGLANLTPQTALLAIEVADSSLRWDLGRKALIYAHCGVPELWVVDAVRRLIHVHRDPGLDGYSSIRESGETTAITSAFVTGLSLTISLLDAV